MDPFLDRPIAPPVGNNLDYTVLGSQPLYKEINYQWYLTIFDQIEFLASSIFKLSLVYYNNISFDYMTHDLWSSYRLNIYGICTETTLL
jgi:hypothetical protein